MGKFNKGILMALLALVLVAMAVSHLASNWDIVGVYMDYTPLWLVLGGLAAVCVALVIAQRGWHKRWLRPAVLAFVMMLALVPLAHADGGDTPAQAINLTPILQAIIGLLAMWISIKVSPWIKARTTKQQQDLMLSTIRILVYAAEQTYQAGQGEEKLKHVQEGLRARGLTVDIDAIEATVRDMNLWVPIAGVAEAQVML